MLVNEQRNELQTSLLYKKIAYLLFSYIAIEKNNLITKLHLNINKKTQDGFSFYITDNF